MRVDLSDMAELVAVVQNRCPGHEAGRGSSRKGTGDARLGIMLCLEAACRNGYVEAQFGPTLLKPH